MHFRTSHIPPFECSEIDHLLQSIIANLANVALIYSETGMTMWSPNARFTSGR